MIDPRKSKSHFTEPMTDSSFRKSISQVCKELGIATKHFTHFGRAIAPAALELLEISKPEIDELGNWNVDVRNAVYSGKMPLRAMRCAAGYSGTQGTHWSPRQTFPVPLSLQQQIFPKLEESMSAVNAQCEEQDVSMPTAKAFLRYLKNLRTVILQDAAILMDKGRKHPVFELPVFKCEAFLTFQSSLLSHLENIESPNDASISKAIPGVKEWLCKIDSSVMSLRSGQQKVEDAFHGVVDVVHGLKVQVSKIGSNMTTHAMFRDALQAGANIFDTVEKGTEVAALESPAMAVVAAVDNHTGQTTHNNTRTCDADFCDDNIEVPKKFLSSTRLVAWWSGNGEFASAPPSGGMKGYMSDHPEHFKMWKKRLLPAPAKRFSRFQELKFGIDKYQQRVNISITNALLHFDMKMNKMSINALIEELKCSGDIPILRKRKRIDA